MKKRILGFTGVSIGINLTQIAIFSFTGQTNCDVYNGAMGIGLGFIAMGIGIYMIIYIRKQTTKNIIKMEGES